MYRLWESSYMPCSQRELKGLCDMAKIINISTLDTYSVSVIARRLLDTSCVCQVGLNDDVFQHMIQGKIYNTVY